MTDVNKLTPDEKRALLAQLLREKAASAPPEPTGWPTIEPDPAHRHEPFPLNEIQQAYWIGRHHSLALGNIGSHFYAEFDSEGLDPARLNQTWQRLVEHHEMLRTIILPDGHLQIMAEVPVYHFPTVDLRGQSEAKKDETVTAIRQQMSHRVYAANEWPLFDIRLTLLEDRRIRLHFSIDIVIADAWSMFMLFSQWQQLYQHPDNTLPEVAISFRDYVLAEPALQETPAYKRSEAYWLEKALTLPPGPALPLAKESAMAAQPRFKRRRATLKANVWQQLKQKGREAGLTPTSLLLAAFCEVLSVWSKEAYFTLNLPIFNRLPVHPHINQVVGDFSSLILLAVDYRLQSSFVERAQQLAQSLSEALEHRFVNGVRVLREMTRKQEGERVLMPVVFTSTIRHQAADNDKPLPMAWLGEMTYGISQVPQVWLDHQVFEDQGALVFNWDAVDGLFPDGLLQDMFTAYVDLLHRLAADQDIWQRERPSLIPPAQLELITAMNETAVPVSDALLHTLFADQVSVQGGHTAIVTPHESFSYQEVAHLSNYFSHQLRQAGVQPNTLVAVIMEKGWEQVIATLAILEAGAAYLPIDPGTPPERLRYLLSNGQVNVALTQPWLDRQLAWPGHLQRLVVSKANVGHVEPLNPLQTPAHLAYVIYTSGSTGKPKGVMIDHQGAVNTILDINQRFAIGPDDRVLFLSALGFDLSVYDIFGTLAAGGTIVIPEAATERDPAHWFTMLNEAQVTVWNSVPALMEMMVEHMAGRSYTFPECFRLVLMSGDWIPLTLPDRIRHLTANNRLQLISLGGATEASIWSIIYPIERVDPAWPSIPYGRPMANQRFYVLDHNLAPRPLFVQGHLYIGGLGVAQGYWHDPEQTAARFIHHPVTGERLYHTGDLGRYLPDGNIEFLGREDFQVKVRGHRIELGEIEAALGQHPQVQSVVVTAVGDKKGPKRLVAYVVPQGQDTDLTAEVRLFLQSKLPDYMVPAKFITLDQLPLTANGKVNRQALPVPDDEWSAHRGKFVPPETPTEETLIALLKEVLHFKQVGIHDNLYEVGLDSLQATRIITNIRETFDIEIPLSVMLSTPTVAQIGRQIETLIEAEIDNLSEEEALAHLESLTAE